VNWETILKTYRKHIVRVSNKGSKQETYTAWNGWLLFKYESAYRRALFVEKIQKPVNLVSNGKIIGQEWPLKSKLK